MSQILLNCFNGEEGILSDTAFRGIAKEKLLCCFLPSCLLVLFEDVGRSGDMVQLSTALMYIHGLLFSWQFPCL